MSALSRDNFVEAVGGTFQVALEGDLSVEMTLETATDLPASGREGGSFRLEFRGPFEPILPQAIYTFSRGERRQEIFIVPVGQGQDGTLYEAIFY